MSLLHRAISALQRSFQTQQEIEDAFLAGAVDIYDLERRMNDRARVYLSIYPSGAGR